MKDELILDQDVQDFPGETALEEAVEGLDRRSFLGRTMLAGATAMLPMAGMLMGGGVPAFAQGPGGAPTAGDIAILKFLAAAELIEDDLWSQYCELAVNNPDYRLALRRIDVSLPAYICQDRDDERSHANLINAYLQSIGEQPINLDPFRTIRPPNVRGLGRQGRLTNLTNLNVDTSWFNRYRGVGNPDLGDSFAQLVNISGKPTVPLTDNMNNQDVQLAAHAAAFHFCAIEQGGSSLYNHLLSQVTSLDALAIVASIGPTEFYHFGVFQTSLEGIFALRGNGLDFPNLKGNRPVAEKVMPTPCAFLRRDFPLCSIVRPRSKALSGARAAAVGLAQSGLLTDPQNSQRNADFVAAALGLADAADAAMRGF